MPDSATSPGSPRAIFLSYASQDAAAARRIADALRATGLEVWFDQSELRGGDAWDQQIRRKIRECALFVPIVSAHTQSRAEGYFRLEWHLAEQRTYLMAHDQPFLLPVVVDATADAEARVPDRFRERQWTRLPGGETPPEFSQRLRQLLSMAPEAPADVVRAALPAPAAAATDRSVAVLAFANMSGDRENEYFSDGVSDELTTVLQKITGLRVAARTSAFTFKGKNATAQEIGSKLGVAHLVEGSVQKSGNRVKITARLSRVASGEEQWSRSYTREISDVFALQEEIALAVVEELRGHLFGSERETALQVHEAARAGTANTEAYQLYLMGRHHASQFSSDSVRRALEAFERAVQIDPAYSQAWAGLARAHLWLCGYDGVLNREQFNDHLDRARKASDRALALDPDQPTGLCTRFNIQFGFDFDWKSAGATVERALELAPSDPEVLLMASRMASTVPASPKPLELAQKAVALDPINPAARIQLALALIAAGRYEESRAESRRIREINPAAMFARSGEGVSYFIEGKYAEAVGSLDPGASDWSTLFVLALAQFGLGKRAEADAALERLVRDNGDTAAIQICSIYAFRNERDLAFEWMERARAQRDPGLATFAASTLFSNLRKDPRWNAFWRSLGISPSAFG